MRIFSGQKSKRQFHEARLLELHTRVFALEKKLAVADSTIRELSGLVNKISKVQFDLANSYNDMVGEIYTTFEKEASQTHASMLLFGITPDDDDDLIN